jgi:hypothetical protein
VVEEYGQPDRLEKGIRFVCGFALGAVLGSFAAAYYDAPGLGAAVGIAAATAVVCGLLAVRYGDRFWYGLRRLRWFFWL